MFTVQNSILYSQPFTNYLPLTAGNGQEPATSAATMIRNSILGAPMTWFFNRNEFTFSTVIGQQDYAEAFSTNGNDFGFVEVATLTDDQGAVHIIKDVYNTGALAASSSQTGPGQRPNALSVKSVTYAGGANNQTVNFRFLSVPDAIYTVTITYQKKAPLFGPFFITAAGNASAGNTAYTGTFDPYSFPVGATANISGFVTNAANNGSFVVVSCTTTTLTVANGAGVAETHAAYATNFDWSPIPDQYSDVYNNLFLSEMLAFNDDARAQLYRQRGVAAFLARASGLNETQKNAFIQQWLARDKERVAGMATTQQAVQARGV